jgi:C-terminal processing protease CtpA/Prc
MLATCELLGRAVAVLVHLSLMASDPLAHAEPAEKALEQAIRKVSDTEYEITPERLVKALSSLPYSEPRAIPYVMDGKAEGLKIYAIQPGTMYERIGLKNGDILQKVGGHEVTSAEQLDQLERMREAAKSTSLTVRRRDQTLTITYRAAEASSGKKAVAGLVLALLTNMRMSRPAAAAPASKPREVSLPSTEDPLAKELDESVQKVGDNKYEIKRTFFKKVLGDSSYLGRSARVVPSVEDGKSVGFKLYAIRPNSLYERLGIRNGDEIRQINDHDVSASDQVLEVYTKLRDAARVTVTIRRRDESRPVTLTYVIR